MAFDPDNASLHAHMERYVTQRRVELENNAAKSRNEFRLFSKLLALDLRVRFHYFFPTDYDYDSPQEAAAAFSSVYVTRRGDTVSGKQLLKFDREKLTGAARRFYRLLGRIRKQLEADFGFKNTDF